MERADIERFVANTRNRAASIAAVTALAFSASGCQEEDSPESNNTGPVFTFETPTTPRGPTISEMIDRNRNGIADNQEPNGSTPQVPAAPNTTTPPAAQTCIRGMKPDSDGDGIPNYCDYFFDRDNLDSDKDKVPDTQDLCTYTKDCDGDGIPDNDDPRPTESKYLEQRREQQRLDEQRQAQKLEEQRREQKRLEEQRLERERLEETYP